MMLGLILLLEEHEKNESEFKIRFLYYLDSQSQCSVIAIQVKHGIYAIILQCMSLKLAKKAGKTKPAPNTVHRQK